MKDKKNLLIAVLLIAVVAMSVGYAALTTTLTVNGTAKIHAGWDVEFTDVQKTIPTGSTAEDDEGSPSFTKTEVTFSTNLKKPGDEETYDVTVSNLGDFNAKLSSIVWSTENSLVDGVKGIPIYVKYEILNAPAASSQLAAKDGDTIDTVTFKVRVYWDATQEIPDDTELIDEKLVLKGTLVYVQAD